MVSDFSVKNSAERYFKIPHFCSDSDPILSLFYFIIISLLVLFYFFFISIFYLYFYFLFYFTSFYYFILVYC